MHSYTPRHPLAVLRRIARLTQKDLATLVDRSIRTVQSIEIGRLPLSRDLAVRISHETGASLQWLLSNDPQAAPTMSLGGLPYTKEVYERTRASFAAGESPDLVAINLAQSHIPLDTEPGLLLRRLFAEIHSLRHPSMDYWLAETLAAVFSAAKDGRASLAIYRLSEFAKSMQKEFGERVDQEFLREASLVFETGLQRLKIAEFLLQKKGPLTASESPDKENTERDVLRETQLGKNLKGLNFKSIWADLNQVGDRLENRNASTQRDYAALFEQMQRVGPS